MTTPKRDINQEAHRIVQESIRRSTDEPLPADLAAAWLQWSRAVKRVDERTMGLLKAAFEAGAKAAKSIEATS